MRKKKSLLFTFLLPDNFAADSPEQIRKWVQQGGRLIVFNNRAHIDELVEKIAPRIDSREVNQAKYWNWNPSALIVYCFDYQKDDAWKTLNDIGAKGSRVWEYMYGPKSNVLHPFNTSYSLYLKGRTIACSLIKA